jgi:hypothetical protein
MTTHPAERPQPALITLAMKQTRIPDHINPGQASL